MRGHAPQRTNLRIILFGVASTVLALDPTFGAAEIRNKLRFTCERSTVVTYQFTQHPKAKLQMGKRNALPESMRVRGDYCTDAKAAEMFVEMVRDDFGFVQEWGWMRWDGKRYAIDREHKVRLAVAGLGKTYKTMIAKYSHPDTAKALMTQARRCESATGIDAILKLAEPLCSMRPDEFDRDEFLINTRNFALDFSRLSGEMPQWGPHSKASFATHLIPGNWDIEAPCPRWLEFLADIFPDAEVREFVQRCVGYSITGSTREQCFFICYGSGANGKSTMLNTLLRVFGPDYGAQADASTFMVGEAKRFDLARLRGVRFLSVIETGEGKRLNEALIKSVTGGDPIVCEFKHKNPFQYLPAFKLWLASNHKPSVYDTSHAMWRRIMLIPFETTIPPEKRDKDIEKKLEAEADGILKWALEGLVSYLNRGSLDPPEAVLGATNLYRIDEDVVAQFLDERTESDEFSTVGKGELYKSYVNWESGKPMSAKKFGTRVAEKGFDEYRDRNGRAWVGLKLIRSDTYDACEA